MDVDIKVLIDVMSQFFTWKISSFWDFEDGYEPFDFVSFWGLKELFLVVIFHILINSVTVWSGKLTFNTVSLGFKPVRW